MTAWDWAVVVAVGALLVVASSYRRRDTSDHNAWQASTAVRTEADVRRDLAAAKADRWQVEQQAFDQTFNQIIAAEYPAIPNPRRTEEPQ